MDKKIVMFGMIVGSTVGGYVPTMFGAEIFSVSSMLCAGAGGILGIWLSFKLLN